jgi:dTDP-glucose 4,6-dehydratase
VAIARPFNTYGPRQSARAVIPTIILQALAGDKVVLGSLHPSRDFTYVEDTVQGLVAVAQSPDFVGDVVNLGWGQDISIGKLAQIILSTVGKDARILKESRRVRPENSEVERLQCDNSRAKELLGWEPRISLKEGLGRTIDWFREHAHVYRRTYAI